MFEKTFFRKECLKRRKRLDLKAQTKAIAAHIEYFFEQHPFEIVGFYVPIHNEIDLRPVLMKLKEKQAIKTLALPKISKGQMRYGVWVPGQDLVKDDAQVPAPRIITEVKPHCLLIPCLAIDGQGYRLGYGGGWYDRYLSQIDIELTIGVLSEDFVFGRFSHEPYDRPLSGWVCENGFTWVKPSRQ